MTESMIERVAKALYARRPNGHGITGGAWYVEPWEKIGDWAQGEHIAIARAAIATMREPTEEMEREAMALGTDYEIEPGVPVTWPPAGKTLWQAMIDAALAERVPE